jgi:hypothetical protein
MTLTLPSPASAERAGLATADRIRRRALERLHKRLKTLDDLIHCLERYQQTERTRESACVTIKSIRKVS